MATRLGRALLCAVLGVAAIHAAQVRAAGFAIIEHSAQGMGNAFAGGGAVAEDASTVFFNPASITRLEDQMQVAAHVILPSFEFSGQSATNAVGLPISGTTAIDGGTDALVPNFYYVRRLRGGLSFGLGVNVPYGLKTEYNTNWVGRYQAVESEIRTVNVNPALALKVHERWSIGAGLNVQYMDATLSSAVDFRSACLAAGAALTAAGNPQGAVVTAACTGPANTALDGFAENEADDVSFGFNLGTLYELSDATRFSLAYRSGIKQDLDGDVSFALPSNPVVQALFATSFINDDITAKVDLPDTLSFSAYHRVNQKLAVMGDATWTRWSSIERLVISYDTATALRPGATVEELRWDDTWRLGLGLNYYHDDRLTLRVGLAYDESPTGDATLTTARLPDADRIWTSIGASYAVNDKLKVDAGYSHLFVDDARINRVGSQGDTLVGSFDSDADIFSLQLSYVFD
jgi:long-chain fatty acid transport protein